MYAPRSLDGCMLRFTGLGFRVYVSRSLEYVLDTGL